ncbi:B12-binding domain-containing radical SAM protein [Bradyrhizobium sp. 83002]|uniref:B12-binding domain-containing radical SAM protein n=1 Tax=Bradyrhizobium aeschynomenes TaxID=2734909 RepID=UPI001557CC3B|nr:radical SAM protein [Bradyrhizobium aeschynomenes]NPU13603.1 B12-binding domain-containing radical SAM protein [Bradyrhizobium aeschynomenes]
MKVAFVHTPMPRVIVPERRRYWQAFDTRYHAAHPNLRPMRKVMWELPHWMHWLGGVLRARGYLDQVAIDFYTDGCELSGIDEEATARMLREVPADIFLFSPMAPNLRYALQIAGLAKQLHSRCRTVFGGVAATPLAEQVAAEPAVDFVIAGRGEQALPALLDSLSGRLPLDEVGHLVRRLDDGRIVRTARTYPWLPVGAIPMPVVELFPAEAGECLRYIRLVRALGCPFECPFCTIQTIGRSADSFTIDRVLAELDAYRDHYGRHHHVYFGDETFTMHPKRTLEFCAALEARGDVIYDIQTRPDLLTDAALLDGLRRSGCAWIEIGIEALRGADHRVLKGGRGGAEFTDTLKRVRDAGLNACSFLINGLPTQTLDDMRRSIDDVCELIGRRLLFASYIFGMVPYPGSQYHAEPHRFGIELLHRDYHLYHEELPPVYRTAHAGPDAMHRVLQDGVMALGEAMTLSEDQWPDHMAGMPRDGYGTFWNLPHS